MDVWMYVCVCVCLSECVEGGRKGGRVGGDAWMHCMDITQPLQCLNPQAFKPTSKPEFTPPHPPRKPRTLIVALIVTLAGIHRGTDYLNSNPALTPVYVPTTPIP